MYRAFAGSGKLSCILIKINLFTINLVAIIKYRVFISGICLNLPAAECSWPILSNIIIKTLCTYNLEHHYSKY